MKNLLTSFLSTGIIQIVNLVTGILAARLLLPEGRGELALLILWPTLIADLGSLGLNTAVSYVSARRHATPPQTFAATLWLATALSLATMGIYAVAVPIVFDGKPGPLMGMAWIYMALIPTHLFSLSFVSQFQGEQRFGEFNALRSVVHLGYLVYVLLLLVLSRATVEGFAWAFLGASATTAAAALLMATRCGWASVAPRRDIMAEMLRYGIRVHVGNVLYIANRKLDQLMISVALAVSDLGLYVVCVTVSGIPMLIASTTDILAFPKMAEQPDDEGRRLVLGRYLRVTLCLVIPSVAALIVVAPELIALLFGRSFVPAANIARILLLSGIAFVFRVFLGSYLRAGDRTLLVTKVEAAGVIVTAVTLGILVPLFGITGAAVAQLISATLPVALCIVLIRREHPFDIFELLTPRQEDVVVFRDTLARWKTRS